MSAIPTGADLIAAERLRQVEVEGWTSAHDREHGSRRIELAADCYAGYSSQWPWKPAQFKPKGRLHNLVVAGALYQAALDIADPESYHARVVVQQRDAITANIDALLTEVAEVLGQDPAISRVKALCDEYAQNGPKGGLVMVETVRAAIEDAS